MPPAKRVDVADLPRTIETLPTTGVMGTEPALSVGAFMACVAAVIAVLGAFGVLNLTDDQRLALMNNGPVIIGTLVAVWTAVQAIVTRQRVFSPQSTATLVT